MPPIGLLQRRNQDARNCRTPHQVQKPKHAREPASRTLRETEVRDAPVPLFIEIFSRGRSGIGPLLYLPIVSASRTGKGDRQSKCDLASPILPHSRYRRMQEPTTHPTSSHCVK